MARIYESIILCLKAQCRELRNFQYHVLRSKFLLKFGEEVMNFLVVLGNSNQNVTKYLHLSLHLFILLKNTLLIWIF